MSRLEQWSATEPSRQLEHQAGGTQPIMHRLVACLIASVLGMTAAACLGLTATMIACAAMFAIIAIAAAVRVNALADTDAERSPQGQWWRTVARRNTRLIAMTYAWAALAMLALYLTPLTGLKWQHGWQYGAGFALLAACALAYAGLIGGDGRPALTRKLARLAAPLAAVQALVAAGGVLHLTTSGKLYAGKGDWAANIVFMFAALAIMVLCALALRADVRVARSRVSGA